MEARHQQRYRSTGLFLAGANLLFLVAIAWHGMVHPFAGATAEQALPLIQERAADWFMMHFFLVAFGRLWAAAALPMLWFIWLGIRLASQGEGA